MCVCVCSPRCGDADGKTECSKGMACARVAGMDRFALQVGVSLYGGTILPGCYRNKAGEEKVLDAQSIMEVCGVIGEGCVE